MPASSFAPIAAGAGVVVLVLCYLLSRATVDGPRRFWLGYVHNYSFFLSLSLGALFFVTLQHLTRSGWSVVVRRPAEILAANLLVLAVAFVPMAGVVAGGSGVLYRWAQRETSLPQDDPRRAAGSPRRPGAPGSPEADLSPRGHSQHEPDLEHHSTTARTEATRLVGVDALTLSKRPYLNAPFFIARWIGYFAVWAGLAVFFWRQSVSQDASGQAALTLRMQWISAPAMLVYSLTVTFAAFDLLMSLDAHWFSTIFGVYYFSGAVVGFFALFIIVLMALQRRGLLTSSISVEHYHDLGKLLFGFVFFWGYIAFSQYMLIWYGNIPEETGWLIRRGLAVQAPNVWSGVILLLLFGNFMIPFVGLLSRRVKRRKATLLFWAIWLLVMHWLDLYWLVMPELTTEYLPLGLIELGCLIGLGAWFSAGLLRLAAGCSLLPVRDPRLGESLAFENT